MKMLSRVFLFFVSPCATTIRYRDRQQAGSVSMTVPFLGKEGQSENQTSPCLSHQPTFLSYSFYLDAANQRPKPNRVLPNGKPIQFRSVLGHSQKTMIHERAMMLVSIRGIRAPRHFQRQEDAGVGCPGVKKKDRKKIESKHPRSLF